MKEKEIKSMKLVLDVKESFGDLLFLGYDEKKKYDSVANRRTEEPEAFTCRLASSKLGGQIEVTVPLEVAVDSIAFSQKVTLRNATIDPYARTSEGSSFAEVILRCNADTILDASKPVGTGAKNEEKKTV